MVLYNTEGAASRRVKRYDRRYSICLLATQIPKQRDVRFRIPLEGIFIFMVVLYKQKSFGGLIPQPRSPVVYLIKVLVSVYNSADKSLVWVVVQR
jgi:hypothetical protein